MALVNPSYKELQEQIVKIRQEKNTFTMQEAAAACSVSEMTVRNFENLKCSNTELFLFYLFNTYGSIEKTPI